MSRNRYQISANNNAAIHVFDVQRFDEMGFPDDDGEYDIGGFPVSLMVYVETPDGLKRLF